MCRFPKRGQAHSRASSVCIGWGSCKIESECKESSEIGEGSKYPACAVPHP
jgi:hypothetical protein